jgi:hypothetical protein
MRLVVDSYKDAFIQIQTKNGTTERIEIGKGVKQGCPLIPTLFNIRIDPLLRNIMNNFQEYGYEYEINGLTLKKTVQAYADDLLFFSNSKENMSMLADGMVTFMKYAQINLNPDKCRILVYDPYEDLPTDFTLPDEYGNLRAIERIETNEVFKYLGVPVGIRKISKMKLVGRCGPHYQFPGRTASHEPGG